MCLFTQTNSVLRSNLRGRTLRLLSYMMISLSLTGCVDDLSLPNFPSLEKKAPSASEDPVGQEYYARVPAQKIQSEILLAEKGNWNLVEKSEVIDPMQAHLAAREAVDTARRKNKKELSAHFQPDAKSGQDGKMRVLRLEPGDTEFEEYQIAESSISKPTHAVAEQDLLNKIKTIFGEDDQSSQTLVVPKRKPVQKVAVVKQEKPRANSVSTASFLAKKPTSSEERMIGGVVVPPITPKQKFAASDVTPHKAAQASAAVSQTNDVVVPGKKPSAMAKPYVRPLSKKSVNTQASPQKQVQYLAEAIRLRSGKHPGRTRLVIEVTETTRYKVAIDHVRNVLRIKIDSTKWRLSPQESFTKSDLLGTYVARQYKDGSVLFEVRLKKKTKILDTMILRPNLSSKHRVVIDLKS